MNRLYTLEGYNNTLGNPLFARFLRMPKIGLQAFKVPALAMPKIQPPRIAVPKIQPPRIAVPKIQPPRIPNIRPPKFPSLKTPKNPFSTKQKIDESSSYMDFFNELESQKQNNFEPEPNYPPTESEFTQDDINQEINQMPVYGYDSNDLMMGKFKLDSSFKFSKKVLNPLGLKTSLGRKKPTLLQKLTFKPGKQKVVKVTPKELKRGLAVTGAVAATIATAGAASPFVAGAATLTGISAGAIASGAGTIATGAALGSTLLASGNPGIGNLLNTAGALLNNQSVKDNIPLANSANQAINTGLNYYNTGAGIAEGLGLNVPSLGTNSQEFFSLFSNRENNVLDRALQIDKQQENQPSPLNPFKNPLTDPTSPLYVPPSPNMQPVKQPGQKLPSTDKKPEQKNESNLGLIIGIGVIGYLFMNRGKK